MGRLHLRPGGKLPIMTYTAYRQFSKTVHSYIITAVKRDAKVLTRYVKRVGFFNIRYTKGVPFPSKMVKRG